MKYKYKSLVNNILFPINEKYDNINSNVLTNRL